MNSSVNLPGNPAVNPAVNNSSDLNRKNERLNRELKALGKVLVAFSGGVDSTFLVSAAQAALGEEVQAVTISTPYIPKWEVEEARQLACAIGVRHRVVNLEMPEELRDNPPQHCYICKKHLFTVLLEVAEKMGIPHVIEGTNADDLKDYRPGRKALAELKIRSPLLKAGLTKSDIRRLSRMAGLDTWDKPAYACLLSRIPVNTRVETADLDRIEKAERFLMDIGFRAVRVRTHGDVARIEVDPDRISELVEADRIHDIQGALKRVGYAHVSVDLTGYRTGSMNLNEDRD